MVTVSDTGEQIVSSEIAKLHFNGDGNALGSVAVLTAHGTDETTIAMHRSLAREMASFSGVEGTLRRLFGTRPVLAGVTPSPMPCHFHRGPAERVTAAGNPVMVLEFDEAGEAFDPGQQDALAEWVRPWWGHRPRIVTAVHSLPGGTTLDAWFLGAFGHALDRVLAAPQFGTAGRPTAGVYVAQQRPAGPWRSSPPSRPMQGAQRLAHQIIMSCQASDE